MGRNPKRKVVFQTSIFRCELLVSGRVGRWSEFPLLWAFFCVSFHRRNQPLTIPRDATILILATLKARITWAYAIATCRNEGQKRNVGCSKAGGELFCWYLRGCWMKMECQIGKNEFFLSGWNSLNFVKNPWQVVMAKSPTVFIPWFHVECCVQHSIFSWNVAVVLTNSGLLKASSSTWETVQLAMEPRWFVGHFQPSQLKMLRVLQSIVFEDLERVTW